MKVNVTLKLFDSQKSKTKAFIVLKIDDTLIIKGLTLVKGTNGLFLSYPVTKGKDDKYYNTVYSLDDEWRKKLEDTCIRKYKEAKNIYNVYDDTTGGDNFS